MPDPYTEEGSVVTLDDNDMVSMPLWYWLKLTDYVIDTQELQKALKEVSTK